MAQLKQKMAVEDLGTTKFLFALVTDARDPCASSVGGAKGQLLQPKSDQERLKATQYHLERSNVESWSFTREPRLLNLGDPGLALFDISI